MSNGQPRNRVKPTAQPNGSQGAAFIEAARALGADQSEEEFAGVLKRVGSHKPPSNARPKSREVKKPGTR